MIEPCKSDTISDYELIEDGKAIRFKPCGVVSHNPNDVQWYYCARCHRFMNDYRLIAERIRKFDGPRQ